MAAARLPSPVARTLRPLNLPRLLPWGQRQLRAIGRSQFCFPARAFCASATRRAPPATTTSTAGVLSADKTSTLGSSGPPRQPIGRNEYGSSLFSLGAGGTYNLDGGALLVPGIQGTRHFQPRRRDPRGKRLVLHRPAHDVDRQRRQRQHQYVRLPGHAFRRLVRPGRPEPSWAAAL